jgi:CO/xanthine dehydrogenase FAD-binding subunit
VRPFQYARPRSLADLFDLVAARHGAVSLLAGGTDLVVRLRMGHARPAVVADLKHIEDLSDRISTTGNGIRVGARATMTAIVDNARMRHEFPALVDAARVVGSIQIRNRATLAGNICNASPAADTAPALLVYDAIANVRGASGRRQVAVADFFTGPGRTVLTSGEVVESIDLPRADHATGSAFGRVTRRYGVDLATVNLCCAVDERGRIRVACGAVAPTPFVVEHDGRGSFDAGDGDAIVAAVLRRASPIDDVRGSLEYRTAMLEVMTRRALTSAVDRLRRQSGHGR